MSWSKATLSEETKEEIEKIGQADILVGIPSYKNERTIGHVISAAQYGLAKYFPSAKAVVMSSDGGSPDRTQEIVRKTDIYTNLDRILVEHPVQPARSLIVRSGDPQRLNAVKLIFEVAKNLDVKACIILDPTLQSINPKWIELLAGPVLQKEYDYVTPYYYCHKYEGMVNSMMAYPFIRALYGKRLRQPIMGELGLSKRLVNLFLNRNIWNMSDSLEGVNVSMAIVAINEGYKVCQAFLGAKVCMGKSNNDFDYLPGFNEVTKVLFDSVSLYKEKWRNVGTSSLSKIYGFQSEVAPEQIMLPWEDLRDRFKRKTPEALQVWRQILPTSLENKIEELGEEPNFDLASKLWPKVFYEFAIAYHKDSSNGAQKKNDIIRAFLPLYYAQAASFVKETESMSISQAEKIIEEEICQSFEKEKSYLVERWDEVHG